MMPGPGGERPGAMPGVGGGWNNVLFGNGGNSPWGLGGGNGPLGIFNPHAGQGLLR